MRRLLLIAAVAALGAACTKPCEQLADEICKCSPTGVSTETCKQQVSNAIGSISPTSNQESACSDYLDSCNAPSGVSFCDWLQTAEGKTACGLAY
jgi:hypothetical protein